MPFTVAHLLNLGLMGVLLATAPLASLAVRVAGAMALVLYGTAWSLQFVPPRWMNTPDPDAFRALNADAQRRVVQVVQRWICWETAGLLAVLCGAYALANHDVRPDVPWTVVGLAGFSLLSSATLPVLFWRVQRTIDALCEQSP